MNVTGLVVSYNTKELLEKSIDSIRKFYPNLSILIIDSSEPENDCFEFVKDLAITDPFIERIYVPGNIGHGKGMDRGISEIKTEFVLLFDSDIEMITPCIEKMTDLFNRLTYGVGQIITVDKNGTNCDDGIPYLHPHFCMIQVDRYFAFPPFVHHGAPLIKAMRQIYAWGHENMLKHFDVPKYIIHKCKGTRDLNPPKFLQNWER